MRIEVKDAQHYLNKEVQSLEQSPVYHGIDSAQLASGYSLKNTVARTTTSDSWQRFSWSQCANGLGFFENRFSTV